MITQQEYFEIDPRKKNEQWADKMIAHHRQQWGHLVDQKRAKEGMQYILSKHDLKNVISMFESPDETGINFVPIAIMEKIRNIVVAERNKAGVFINLNAIDPSARKEKDADYQLLKNRRDIERTMTGLDKQMGLPEYKLSNEKKLSGKSAFNGNIGDFDELQLDDSEGYHIDYFFKTHYKLMHEIRGQEVLNYFVKFNDLKSNIDYWCNDILAKKAIAMRMFVNEISGAIEYKYMPSEKIKLVPGKRKDGKDAECIGYEDTMKVGDWIKLVGNSFDWNTEADFLVRAVNSNNALEITGVMDDVTGNYSFGNSSGTTCSYSAFMQYNVSFGYMEFKSIDANSYKVGKNFHGNKALKPINPNRQLSNDTVYAKESFYNEVTYKSYFLVLSPSTHRLYKFGKLFHQAIEGSEDEYSNFSIIIRQQEGPTVAEIAAPFIEIAQEAFYKFKWMIRKAKPKGRVFAYESIVKVATKMIGTGNKAADVHQVIKMFEDGINELYSYPEIDGKAMGGGSAPNFDKMNGLDPTAMKFSEIIDWAVNQISDKLGINSIREAYSPSPNDGYKLQMQTLQQSRNATDYISQMIMSVLENCGKNTLNITQDIIRYKGSIAYDFLKKAVGEETLRDLEDLKGFAFHRYGIFIDTFNNDIERQEIKAATMDAWGKGEITYETMLMVNGIDDPKKAGLVLSFEKWRKDKEKQKEIQQQQQNLLQIEQQKHQLEMERIVTKGKLEIEKANVEGKWYFEAHKSGSDAKILSQQMRNENEPEKIHLRTEGEIEKEIAKSNIKNQQPVTNH